MLKLSFVCTLGLHSKGGTDDVLRWSAIDCIYMKLACLSVRAIKASTFGCTVMFTSSYESALIPNVLSVVCELK
jgi:hypothetical protein